MHIERLRQVKPTLSINAPKRQQHLTQNLKRELSHLGKYFVIVSFMEMKDQFKANCLTLRRVERMTEI